MGKLYLHRASNLDIRKNGDLVAQGIADRTQEPLKRLRAWTGRDGTRKASDLQCDVLTSLLGADPKKR